jgi:hypothetical protein
MIQQRGIYPHWVNPELAHVFQNREIDGLANNLLVSSNKTQ